MNTCVVCQRSLDHEVTYRCTYCQGVGHQRCGLLHDRYAHRGICPDCRVKGEAAAALARKQTVRRAIFIGLAIILFLIVGAWWTGDPAARARVPRK